MELIYKDYDLLEKILKKLKKWGYPANP